MNNAITDGTEKQNSFATSLRTRFVEGCHAQIGFAQRPGWDDDGRTVARLERAIARAESIVNARFWLDRSRRGFGEVLADVLGDARD